jgi:hypothetical protein
MKEPSKPPAPATTEDKLAAALARIEQLENRLAAATNTAPQEEKVRREQDWARLETAKKNQAEADRLYGPDKGGSCWEVSLGKLIPPIRLYAHSEHEAKAFFMELCGIKAINPSPNTPALEVRKAA